MKNDREPQMYNVVAKGLHWLMALIILGLLIVGFYMADMEASPEKLKLYGLHKSFGILVLMLVMIRVAWRFMAQPPKALPTHAAWEKVLSHLVHILLYAVMIAMPLSGWVMSSSGDFPNSFFGLFEMPDIVAKNKDIFEASEETHEFLALVIIGVVALHMAGALKHHFIDRDATLARMTRKNIGLVGGVILTLFWGGLWLGSAGQVVLHEMYEEHDDHDHDNHHEAGEYAQQKEDHAALDDHVQQEPAFQGEDFVVPDIAQWQIMHEESEITFKAAQYGQDFDGRFEEFDGQIYFDPEHLDQSLAKIEIRIASIKTGSDDRDGQALSADWFEAEKFPVALFEAHDFDESDSNRYVANGHLTLRGVTLPVSLPFTLQVEEEDDGAAQAEMEGELSLNRLDFGIGQGQWSDDQAIGNAVKIKIKIHAQKL